MNPGGITALRNPRFRLLWANMLCSSTAKWADLVVVGWLTLELTDSALMVGVVGGCKMAGYLVAPFMGVAADRMDRRKLLLLAASVNWGTALTMLLLILGGWLQFWHIVPLTVVSSVTWALDQPTRQAFVGDLVDKQTLPNAIALNSVANEITVVVGPALGGLMIPSLGTAGAYTLIAGLYFLDVVLFLALKSAVVHRTAPHERPLSSLATGLRYVRGNHTVLTLLLVAFLMNLFAAPYRYSFLPLFSRYVLDVGAAGYGMLTSMAGVGALVAGIAVVSAGSLKTKGRIVLVSGMAWSVSLLLFALSTSYALSLALIFVAGLTQAVTWTLIATLILGNTEQSMRGRVMGLRTSVVVALPVGNFFAGAAAEHIGAPAALGIYATSALLIMLAMALLAPELRRLE